jgi:tRNA(Ile)-lysidine synthase
VSAGRSQTRALERRVCDFVASRGVLRPGERPLLLLSGGPDSMCLLHLLAVIDRRLALGVRAAALHVDYGLRGGGSDRDRELVEEACAVAGLTLHVERLEGSLRGPNFQARARDQRYRLARELAARFGYGPLTTAHNRDDQAETVLYRLVKYASPLGLAGMRPLEDDLARPLLVLGAGEVRAYCEARGIAYGVDASNLQPLYARNVLRLEVLPGLERLNPQVGETLADNAAIAAAERVLVEAALDEAWRRVAAAVRPGEIAALDLAVLAAEPPALRTLCLHRLAGAGLEEGAFVARRQAAALEALAGRRDECGRVSLRGGREAVRERGRLAIRTRTAAHACAPVRFALPGSAPAQSRTPEPGPPALPTPESRRRPVRFCRWRVRAVLRSGAHPPGAHPAGARPDERRLALGFDAPPRGGVLRHPRRGERFTPFGRTAATTVARFLAGAGCPSDERRRALVLEFDGALAAVAFVDRDGVRRSRVARERTVTQSTRWTLSVTLEER